MNIRMKKVSKKKIILKWAHIFRKLLLFFHRFFPTCALRALIPNSNSVSMTKSIEQISYDYETVRHTARYRMRDIILTNDSTQYHCLSNQNTRTQYRHGHGTFLPFLSLAISLLDVVQYISKLEIFFNIFITVVLTQDGNVKL